MPELPDYDGLDVPSHIDDAVDIIIDWAEDTTVDVVELNRCNENAVTEFLKNISKLSPLISVEIETRARDHLRSEFSDILPSNINWVVNERIEGEKYPDLALADLQFDPPSNWVWAGIEIKAWCPLATEISGRMMKGQSIMEEYPDQLVLIVWLPENLLYGEPKILATWVGEGQDIAKARDDHWHWVLDRDASTKSSLILEPDFSPDRDPHKQHTNVYRYKWDDDSEGSQEKLDELEERAEELGIIDEPYSPEDEFQKKVQTLRGEFSEYFTEGSNFRKIGRCHYDELEEFQERFKKETFVEGKSVAQWESCLKNGNPEPFSNVLSGTQKYIEDF